jgi:hypothetical protein
VEEEDEEAGAMGAEDVVGRGGEALSDRPLSWSPVFPRHELDS